VSSNAGNRESLRSLAEAVAESAVVVEDTLRKSWFEKGTSEASYKVSIVVTNYVDAMTPTGA
jgi:hypothetical protein